MHDDGYIHADIKRKFLHTDLSVDLIKLKKEKVRYLIKVSNCWNNLPRKYKTSETPKINNIFIFNIINIKMLSINTKMLSIFGVLLVLKISSPYFLDSIQIFNFNKISKFKINCTAI